MLSEEIRNTVLRHMAHLLDQKRDTIIGSNHQDFDMLEDGDPTISERLLLDNSKIDDMVKMLQHVASQVDPVGKVLSKKTLANELLVVNKTVPFGTIFIIYESRPDVTVEAAALAFKAGNYLLLKGGKEAINTNRMLISCWEEALDHNGLSKEWIKLLEFNREETKNFLRRPERQIDLVVPRGGEKLISFVKEHSTSPIIVSGRGNNFAYVADDADWQKVAKVILNAKTQKVSACNALDKIIFDKRTVSLGEKLRPLLKLFSESGIQIESSEDLYPATEAASIFHHDSIWNEEFLSLRLAVGSVDGIKEAINFINKYSGGHSAVIFTESEAKAVEFMDAVDCAAVYQNASTRFTDGGSLGMGAELAISTDKLHHRGPLGLENLVTNKFYIFGNGQIRK